MGEIDDLLIIAADKELSTSATEKATQMLEGTTTFSGIGGSVDLFQGPSNFPPSEEWIESSSIALEAPEVIVSDFPVFTRTTNRKRKR